MGWLRLLLDKLSVSWLDALFGFLYAVVGLITFSAVWHFTHIDPRFFLILLVAKGLWAIFEGLPFRITEVLSGEDYVLLTRPSLWRYMAAASIEAEYLLVLLIQLIVLLPFIGNYYIFIFLGTAIVLGAEILYALLSIILGGQAHHPLRLFVVGGLGWGSTWKGAPSPHKTIFYNHRARLLSCKHAA